MKKIIRILLIVNIIMLTVALAWSGEKLSKKEQLAAALKLSQTYYQQKDYSQAIAANRNCLMLKRNCEQARLNLACIYREMQMYPEALKEIDWVNKKGKFKYEYNLTKGQIYQSLGVYEKAINYLSKALAVNSLGVEPHFALGEIYYEQKNFEKALTEFKLAAEFQQQVQVYQKLALCFFYLGRPEKALASLSEAVKLAPEDYLSYCISGLIYSAGQDWEKALSQFNAALALKPESPLCLLGQGWCLDHLKKQAEATSSFEKIVDAKNVSWVVELARKNLGEN